MRVINYIIDKLRKIRPMMWGLFARNTSRKLISVAIAIIIWVMAVNISNPEVTVEQTVNVSVNYANALEGANQTYTLETTTARISYTIRSDNRRYVNASHFNAYVNLIDLSITGSVPIYVEVDPSVESLVSNVSVSPMVVRVDTEDMVEKSFDVAVNIEGSAASGKAIGDLEMTSNTITLYGPSSDVERVGSVSINIPVNYADSDISGIAEPVFYDSDKNEISLDSKTQIRETFSYTLHIYNTKRFAILASYIGIPASGYTVSSVTCDPASLVVYGSDSLLDLYSNIEIPSSIIDVSGASSNVAVLIDAGVYLPDGLNLVDSGDVSIVANVVRASTIPQGQGSGTSGSDETTASQSISGTETLMETETETEISTQESSSENVEEIFSSSDETIAETNTLPHSSESSSETREIEPTETHQSSLHDTASN